jgi:stage V sporulation protein G
MLILKGKRYTQLKITDIRIRLIPNTESKLKAVASITIDECFVVHDIKVLEGNQGYFVSMPTRKTPEGEYKDVAHPINTPTREEINRLVLAKYEEEKNAQA